MTGYYYTVDREQGAGIIRQTLVGMQRALSNKVAS
jgi:hypothetical protein